MPNPVRLISKLGKLFEVPLAEQAHKAPKNVPAGYLTSTPLKPDPSVGTRFEREFTGGLAEKKPLKLEDYRGASMLVMPWDSTSRNYRVSGFSGETLPVPFLTHGGQDYARDLAHIREGIGGASNLEIAKRIRDRDAMARMENINAGGTGEILHLPATMGPGAENFSAMPLEGLLGLLDLRALPAKDIKALDKSIREFKVAKGTGANRRVLQPFKKFSGLMTEEGRTQMFSGEGLESTAGELRKAIVDRLYLKENQERLGFNAEDLAMAVKDPALVGVPKGYVGNTVLMTDPGGMHLRPSANRTYSTDFTGDYQGTLGHNIPAEVLFPDVYGRLANEFSDRSADLRNMVLGAMEKRSEGVSQIIDSKLIDDYYKYLEGAKKPGGLLD
jgi:hypothetical protein